MATFNGYVRTMMRKVDFEVTSKVRTATHGHYTYALCGEYVREDGTVIRCGALVNKGQWDRYDVPVTDKVAGKNRKADHLRKRRAMERVVPSKNYRKSTDEEIERWLLEHAEMNFESLDSNRITTDE